MSFVVFMFVLMHIMSFVIFIFVLMHVMSFVVFIFVLMHIMSFVIVVIIITYQHPNVEEHGEYRDRSCTHVFICIFMREHSGSTREHSGSTRGALGSAHHTLYLDI